MTEPTDATTTTGADDTGQQEPAKEYVPPASQADLDRIIAERVARTKNQFKDYAELKAAKTELDTIKQANQTEAERQAEELSRWQADSERWRTAALSSRVENLAADFADPTDALSALGDTSRYLDAGGQIDDEAIRRDLTELLERKPHWRRPDGTPAPARVPAPNPAQGSGGGTAAADPATEFASILRQGLARS